MGIVGNRYDATAAVEERRTGRGVSACLVRLPVSLNEVGEEEGEGGVRGEGGVAVHGKQRQ